MVVLLSLPNCFQCKMSKRRMKEKGIIFEEVDMSRDEAAMKKAQDLGYKTAPITLAGDDHWSGFRPDKIDTLS